MRVRQRKLYKKITLLKYNVGVQAALYAKEAYRTKSVCENPYNTRYLLVL